MTDPDLEALARRLHDATGAATAVPQLSLETPLTLDQAYAVQTAGVRLREGSGERVVGLKLGFTSRAKAEQMGVDDVIVGVITDAMEITDGGTLDPAAGVHPRVEPEVAFRLSRAIDPAGPDEPEDLLDAVADVAPALEVIDSRYRDFSFSLTDVVADNTSAHAFVVGAWQPLATAREQLDLASLEVTLAVDDQVVQSGSTRDILGDPLNAIAEVTRMAGLHGLTLPAGSVILAGAATAAVAVSPQTSVRADVAGLGSVSMTVGGTA